MKAVVKSLHREGAFRRGYDSDNAQGNGEREALSGLAPLGLFLEVLGVRVLNSKQVVLTGSNPYPWPVTVKYQGMTVVKSEKKTLVVFPDGQNITVDNDQNILISREVRIVNFIADMNL